MKWFSVRSDHFHTMLQQRQTNFCFFLSRKLSFKNLNKLEKKNKIKNNQYRQDIFLWYIHIHTPRVKHLEWPTDVLFTLTHFTTCEVRIFQYLWVQNWEQHKAALSVTRAERQVPAELQGFSFLQSASLLSILSRGWWSSPVLCLCQPDTSWPCLSAVSDTKQLKSGNWKGSCSNA